MSLLTCHGWSRPRNGLCGTIYGVATAVKSLDLSVAAIHGPAFWGWRPRQSSHETLAYRAAYGGFTVAGLIEALFLHAAASARVGLFIALAASVAAWSAVGQIEIIPVFPSVRLAIRMVSGVSILSTFGALAGDQFGLRVWPLSVALGIELYITMRSIGVSATGASVYRSVVVSSAHLAVAGILLVIASVGTVGLDFDALLPLYAGIHVQLAVTLVSFEFARRFRDSIAEELDASSVRGRASGLGARTSWLHDTAISDLKGLLNSSRKDDAEFLAESIARIEDELRDEYLQLQMVEANEVDLGAVMYRYARKFRSQGRVIDLPGLEVSQTMVDGSTGQRFKGFLDVAVQNAVDAGAQRVTITVEPERDYFIVAVSDDAGGFDHELAMAGGSLTRLKRDSTTGIEILVTESGTKISTRIELAVS